MTRLRRALVLLIGMTLTSLQMAMSQDSPLAPFEKLIGGTWLVEGTWPDGSAFKQEYIFESSLNGKLIKVKTMGTVDQETNTYGLRNEGLRSYNPADSTFLFWEFDVFGGLTSGTATVNEEGIHYDYVYNNQNFRDSWLYVNEDEYELVVSSVKDGEVDQVYQRSPIKRTN